MVTKVESGKTYLTLANAQVFKADSSGKLSVAGSLKSGASVQCSGGKFVGGVLYGVLIAGAQTFEPASRAGPKSSAGLLVPALALLESLYDNLITTSTSTGGTMSGISKCSKTFTVKSGKTARSYQQPTSRSAQQKEYPAGSQIKIFGTKKDSSGCIWGCTNSNLSSGWVMIYYSNGDLCYTFEETKAKKNTSPSANNPSSVTTNNGKKTSAVQNPTPNQSADDLGIDTEDYSEEEVEALLSEIDRLSTGVSASSYEKLAKMEHVIGIPPRITQSADPHYMTTASPSNTFGRSYAEMLMMNNTVFSIQPCKVKYLPGFRKEEKVGFMQLMGQFVSNAMDDEEIRNGKDAIGLSGQLFESVPDYNQYINTVNLLARTMSVYLGIGDRRYLGTGPQYRQMDYSFYKIKSNNRSIRSSSGGLLGAISDTVRAAYSGLVTDAISDDTYIHFYATADGTSMSDSMSVSTRTSGLESLFNNGLSEMAADLQFLMGGAVDKGIINEIGTTLGTIGEGILGAVPGDVGATLKNIIKSGANYLQGGRLVFPKMLDDCDYDRSYSVTCRFISPSGDREAIFLNCFLPLAYILPFVLPQMLSDNMYRYPFVAKVDVPSLVHCDLAAVTGLRIQRGGADGNAFTIDGLPFEIDVNFDITPLYSKLMVTGANHPYLFMSNTALHEYLGSMCGVSFTGDQTTLKMAVVKALLASSTNWENIGSSIIRSYYDSGAANALRKIFNF